MAFKLPDRVLETTTTTGTGSYTLGGAYDGRHQTFAQALANGDTTHYFIYDPAVGGASWEVGYGTYNAGVLARTTVLQSSNADAAVNWGAGTKIVGIGPIGPSDLDDANKARVLAAMFPADVVIPTVVTVPNVGLHLLDSDASHDLIVKPGSNLAADRTLTVTTGDADRTLDISAGSVTISAAGAALIDDASATAQRTTLAAAGTGVTNAFGADQIITKAAPALILRDTTPFAVDNVAGFLYGEALDSTSVNTTFATLILRVEDPTNGSEDGYMLFRQLRAGASTDVLTLRGGGIFGNPTGGDKGIGTVNAVGVYDDNVLLTCPALQAEFIRNGAIDLAKWDALVPDRVTLAVIEPARVERVPVLIDAMVTTERRGSAGEIIRTVEPGKIQLHDWTPIYDGEGNGLDAIKEPVFDDVTVPEKVLTPEAATPRRHEVAHLFDRMVKDGFDPRNPVNYIDRMKRDAALPGMPTEGEWEHGKYSTGEIASRMWLAVEFLALAFMGLEARVAAIEARR